MYIDLNSDLGESFGRYRIGNNEAIVPLVTSVNAACGFHAGDPVVMMKTVALAESSGTAIGAHPGFDDLQGFGRRNVVLSHDELRSCILYQLGALDAFAKDAGTKLQHIKLHGAMYNMAAKDADMSEVICRAVKSFNSDLIILAQGSGETLRVARDLGMRAAAEVFADRAYNEDGTLVARSRPDSMITDPDVAIKRVIRMITEGKVEAVTGKDIDIKADSVCVHGDGEKALEFVKSLRNAFAQYKIDLVPLRSFI